MKAATSSYVKSAMEPSQYPADGRPEFAFVGRSNVGKSSLLNVLLGQKGLSKTSSRPGKTQTVNFFDVNGRIYFVDLPGYGYAKVPLQLKERWGKAMTAYLRDRAPLRLVLQLVDARHKPTEKDDEMLDLLEGAHVPTVVVATKIDKVKRSERAKNLRRIRETLGLDGEAALVQVGSVIPFHGLPLYESGRTEDLGLPATIQSLVFTDIT
ncbi:MAG: ribosome biogenesis GTP-binding protein YihA/YsxC, partial [Candidatus Hydrogenedentes bacterium]|nr:ribosome biogenesis GTP-binding protein YihA/YsxC [Candidatus Hydrogenedentota bacterium]